MKMKPLSLFSNLLALLAVLASAFTILAADKKIVLVAGGRGHGPGEHEFGAGCLLLKGCLDKLPGLSSHVYSNGWPKDVAAFDGAAAIIIYADGGDGRRAIQGDRLKMLDELMKKGVGL